MYMYVMCNVTNGQIDNTYTCTCTSLHVHVCELHCIQCTCIYVTNAQI